MAVHQLSSAVSLIADHVVREMAHGLQQAPERISLDLPFADMGADSLILAEALQEVNRRFRLTLTVGEIYEKINTIAKVAQHIHDHGAWQAVVQGTAPANDVVESEPEATIYDVRALRVAPSANGSAEGVDRQSIEHIVRHQLELMERQLSLLAKGEPAGRRAAVPGAPAAIAAKPDGATASSPPNVVADRFSAFSIRLEDDSRKDDADKVRHIGGLAARLNRKTAQSKEQAQSYRRVLADNRVSAGFRPLLKQIVYPIMAEQAQGARVVDIDGNEYVDFTMGFGAYLFGHSPDFVVSAIKRQIDKGMPIGPQSPMAGRVAELICELTGHERVMFCNSGTEATMTAVRLARAKAGRSKIAIFKNSYHGTFDGFLARSASDGGSRPASLGTPDSMVQDTMVLDYCDRSALDTIERHHQEIAAVLVEPVQSRAPGMQPASFLAQLRDLTRDKGIALIFDEVITGFRCAPGGAQEYFGAKADLCTYGKIVGGGMPIGIVAGAAAYMDGIDGGWWQYDDGSYPRASTIFFAGTFSKHPLALAAAMAVLQHIKSVGMPLFQALNDNARRLCERLNAVFDEEGVDIKVEHFSSLFRFSSKGNIDLFFYHLLDAGIYIWEGRNCFLSTAHSEGDMDRLVQAVRDVCRALAPANLLPASGAARNRTIERYPIGDAQHRFYHLERSGPEGAIACNVCFGFAFEAPVAVERLAEAAQTVLMRQEALWCRFDLEGAMQQRMAPQQDSVAQIAVPRPATAVLIGDLLAEDQKAPLDIKSGRTIRVRLYSFADGAVLLSFCAHHLVCDGWGLAVLLQRIADVYNRSPSAEKAADVPYARWLDHESRYRQGDQYQKDRQFWQAAMARIVAYRNSTACGAIEHADAIGPRKGARASLVLDEAVTTRFLAKAKADGATPFTWLLSSFQTFLGRVYRDRLPVIGIPFANRTGELKKVVGNCVNLLPLLPCRGDKMSFGEVLAHTKAAMDDLFAHSRFPYHDMCAAYQALSSQDRGTPVTITFNIEPLSDMPRFGDGQPTLIAPVNSHIEFDLMFNMFLLKSGLRIELDYNTDLFAEDAVYGWLYLFAKIVELQSAAQRSAPVQPVEASPAKMPALAL